jgi:hypothetical protein
VVLFLAPVAKITTPDGAFVTIRQATKKNPRHGVSTSHSYSAVKSNFLSREAKKNQP